MRGEDTAKLKTAQLFLYIVHTDVFNDVSPFFVFGVADAVEDKPPGGNAERNAQGGHVFAVGNGLVQVFPIHHVEHSIPEAPDHKNGAIGNKAKAAAAPFVELYALDFLIMHAHDIAAGGIGLQSAPDGRHLAHIIFFYKKAVVPD